MSALKPVTAGEVDVVEFTVVNRFFGRPGYDETEVDDFLDRCAETIATQAREIERLGVLAARQREASAQRAGQEPRLAHSEGERW